MLIKLQNQILTAQTKLKEQKLQCDQVSNNNTNTTLYIAKYCDVIETTKNHIEKLEDEIEELESPVTIIRSRDKPPPSLIL